MARDDLKLVAVAAAAAPRRGAGTIPEVDWSILMARAQGGDRVAYVRLLESVTPVLRAHVSRWHDEPADQEDVVQDILLTLHTIRHTYDPARPFGPWLLAIASRRAVDRIRRRSRQRARETPLRDAHEAVAETRGDTRHDAIGLEAVISTLPAGQRQAIRLLRLEEKSLEEASAASGMSVGALKVSAHRALARLRRMLLDRSER